MGMGTMSLFFSLRKQLQEVRANQSNDEEKIVSLSSIQNADALKVNRKFLKTRAKKAFLSILFISNAVEK